MASQSGLQSDWASGLQSGAAGSSHRGSSTPSTTGVAARCAPGESTGLVRACLLRARRHRGTAQKAGSRGRPPPPQPVPYTHLLFRVLELAYVGPVLKEENKSLPSYFRAGTPTSTQLPFPILVCGYR